MNIDKYIDNEFDNMCAALDRIVRIPSVKGIPCTDAPYGENALKAVNETVKIATEMGFYASNYHNRLAIIDLYDNKEPEIGILAHADVVPAGDGWTHEPFALTLDEGKLFGRGTTDDKGPVISSLYALKYIKDFYHADKNIRIIVGSDEECGSSDIDYYVKHEKLPKCIFTPDANYPVINTEKGRIAASFIKTMHYNSGKRILSAAGGSVINAVPDRAYAKVQGFTLEELSQAAEQCPSDLKYEFTYSENELTDICVTGKSAHASTPSDGINAVTGLCELLAKVSDEWKTVTNICPHGDIYGKKVNIDCSDEISGKLTFSFNIVSFNGENFEGQIDIRFPICKTAKEIEENIRQAFAREKFEVKVLSVSEPHHTSEESPIVKTLLETYEKVTGIKGNALAVGGGTYAHNICGAVAFGPELPGEDNHIHSEDEFTTVENFKLNCKMIAEALMLLDKRI